MRNRTVGPALACIGSLVAYTIIVLDVDFGAARALGGVLLVLVLPGYSLSALFFARGVRDRALQLALVAGLSMGMTILIGLVLNWTPWGTRVDIWAGLLTVQICISSSVAYVRNRVFVGPLVKQRNTSPPLFVSDIGMLVGAVVIVVVAVTYARDMAIEIKSSERQFTQMWLLPGAQPDDASVRVGVTSYEPQSESYSVSLWAGQIELATWSHIVLLPGETWSTEYSMPAGFDRSVRLEARAFLDRRPEMTYRYVNLNVNSLGR